jgi:uncharacterized protein YggE
MGDDTITVTGEAARHAAPEVAAWEVTVEATDPDPSVAYERCAEKSSAVVERLKAVAEVETQGISVHRDWVSDGDGKVEHEATMDVVVRAPVAMAAELGAAAMASGAQRIDGPWLSIVDRATIELDVLEEAVADARHRAERLAAAAARRLGRIVSIDARRYRIYEQLVSSRGEMVPVEPGDLDISASVTVVFALAD